MSWMLQMGYMGYPDTLKEWYMYQTRCRFKIEVRLETAWTQALPRQFWMDKVKAALTLVSMFATSLCTAEGLVMVIRR